MNKNIPKDHNRLHSDRKKVVRASSIPSEVSFLKHVSRTN
jgi:hypothetical protein